VMLRHVATVLLVFQRFPITPGNSVQHECNMDAPLQPLGGWPWSVLAASSLVTGFELLEFPLGLGLDCHSSAIVEKPRYYQQNAQAR
jgi:hypothetical protein